MKTSPHTLQQATPPISSIWTEVENYRVETALEVLHRPAVVALALVDRADAANGDGGQTVKLSRAAQE